ncbi:MAG: LuxR C-terminal-related transcriptional regulator [Micrococcales bacterium]|nr:LuxR C-terminal-related transcriptional regulator [Micrococcales bacterium]
MPSWGSEQPDPRIGPRCVTTRVTGAGHPSGSRSGERPAHRASRWVPNHRAGQVPPSPHPDARCSQLEVLRLVARCTGDRDIARALCAAENAVKNRARNILEKLQLHFRIEAYSARGRLVDAPAR